VTTSSSTPTSPASPAPEDGRALPPVGWGHAP
jgi:hypothetical protein